MGIKKKYICLSCNQETIKENCSGKYCSNKCQQKFQKEKIISNWKTDHSTGMSKSFRLKNPIREYIFDKYDHKCCHCSWDKINPTTGLRPLEIDHIDGDCTNNKEENLRLLCPNCHSLTSNYRALNAGNGNRNRLKYFGLIR